MTYPEVITLRKGPIPHGDVLSHSTDWITWATVGENEDCVLLEDPIGFVVRQLKVHVRCLKMKGIPHGHFPRIVEGLVSWVDTFP